MRAFLVATVVALSCLTSAAYCSLPKYENRSGWAGNCEEVWSNGELAECYDDLTYTYSFLTTRFAVRLGVDISGIDTFGVYKRLAEGSVVLMKNMVSAAFQDNCHGPSAIKACREMVWKCDKVGHGAVFDAGKWGATEVCKAVKWTGLSGIIQKMPKTMKEYLGPWAKDDAVFAEEGDCEKAGSVLALADGMTRGGGKGLTSFDDDAWNVLSVSTDSVGPVGSFFFGILYGLNAFFLRERTCKLYLGLVQEKIVPPEEAGLCIGRKVTSLEDIPEGAWDTTTREPIKPEYNAAAEKEVEERIEKEKKKKKEEEEEKKKKEAKKKTPELQPDPDPPDPGCEADRDAGDKELKGCLNGLNKLFTVAAVEHGADSAVKFAGEYGDIVQAVAGLAGVRHALQFMKTSYVGRDFDPGKCLQRIYVCRERHPSEGVRKAVSPVAELLRMLSQVEDESAEKLAARICQEHDKPYLQKVLKLVACAERTHRAPITARSCRESLEKILLEEMMGSKGQKGAEGSLRHLLRLDGDKEDGGDGGGDEKGEFGELKDGLGEVAEKAQVVREVRAVTTKWAEERVTAVLDFGGKLGNPVLGLVAAFMAMQLSACYKAAFVTEVDLSQLFQDDIDLNTLAKFDVE